MAARIVDLRCVEEPRIVLNDQPAVHDADIQQIIEEATRPQSASIITFGKVGSGKSSLASCVVEQNKDTTFKSKEGFKSDKMNANRESFEVGQVTLNVVDTHGMMDTSPGTHKEDTIAIVDSIVRKESKGVLIVCIEMYERVDKSTLKALAKLHGRYKKDVWYLVVIALTKADKYEEHKWLKLERFGKSKKECLSEKFAATVEKCKTDLKSYFTAANTEVKPSCYFGMTEEEFDELNIPIIPTSELNKVALDRMKRVGCGYWFDILLIKCCQRLRGCGLLIIHEKRLMKLPLELVRQEVGQEAVEWIENNKSKWACILGIIYVWYQKYTYYKETATLPRLQQQMREALQQQTREDGLQQQTREDGLQQQTREDGLQQQTREDGAESADQA